MSIAVDAFAMPVLHATVAAELLVGGWMFFACRSQGKRLFSILSPCEAFAKPLRRVYEAFAKFCLSPPSGGGGMSESLSCSYVLIEDWLGVSYTAAVRGFCTQRVGVSA